MKRPKSRERILSSAIEVFAEKGRHRATMKEIAARASVGTSLLYRTYPTKSILYEEVLEKVMEEGFRQLEGAAARLGDDADSVQALLGLADVSLDVLSRNPHIAKIVLRAATVGDGREFLSAARNVKSRLGGGNMAAFKRLLQKVGAGYFGKHMAFVDPAHLLALMMGVNLTYLLGKPIAEIILDMKVEDERALSEAIRRNVLDVLTYGISKATAK